MASSNRGPQPLTGLNGLAGYQVQIDSDSQATPEERHGGPADEYHGHWGEQAAPYPWQSSIGMGGSHGPYGLENSLLGDADWVLTPGAYAADDPTFDWTPGETQQSHGAPSIPRGGPVPSSNDPNQTAVQLEQSALLHAVDTKAALRRINPPDAIGIQNDIWATAYDDTSAGSTDVQPISRQAMSSGFMYGTTDRTQSFARQNEYGFDSAHKFRRTAVGSIPGNTMWLKPGGRPLAKSLPGPARPPIGPDSPFAGQDLGQAFSPQGAWLMDQPTVYEPPSQPYLAPRGSGQETDPGNVEWY